MTDDKDNDKKKKVGLVEIASIKDLVHLIVRLPFQIINHMELKGKHIYFILLGSGLPGISTTLYYILTNEPFDANYIIFNSMKDTIAYSKSFEERRGGITYIPIINIKKQNLIEEDIFDI
ncbi:MAG: hypothetical protein GF329_06875 [Candidatus Lokiarchaeota archaeon]|nr:hypothetical protein [Candidatus Lokiarchaeota archaeon]